MRATLRAEILGFTHNGKRHVNLPRLAARAGLTTAARPVTTLDGVDSMRR